MKYKKWTIYFFEDGYVVQVKGKYPKEDLNKEIKKHGKLLKQEVLDG